MFKMSTFSVDTGRQTTPPLIVRGSPLPGARSKESRCSQSRQKVLISCLEIRQLIVSLRTFLTPDIFVPISCLLLSIFYVFNVSNDTFITLLVNACPVLQIYLQEH